MEQVIKFTVYLTDLNQFAILNRVFERYFSEDPPARSVVQVAALPMNAQVEIEAVAIKS